MEYVVLGGNGFIGSYLVDVLLKAGHCVTVFDRGNEKYRNPLENVNYVSGSIDDELLLAKTFANKDILIHCVSTTVPLTSNGDIIYDINSNLITSVNIFKIAVECGIKRIVYLSSGGAVYGTPMQIPIPETHPTNPISSYGITKLAIEKYLQFFSQNYGVEYNIVRPSNPYGPRQNPFGNQGVISIFLGRVLNNQSLDVWGDGKVYKDYIYIEDLVNAIYEASISKTTSQIFNLGSGELVSINDIIHAIKAVTQKEIKVNYLESKKFDVQKVNLDIKKAENLLNFKPKVSIEDGVSKTWEFVRQL